MKHYDEKLSADTVNGYSGIRLGPEAAREMFWAAPELVALLDAEGGILMVNRAVTEATGYEEGELLGKRVFDYMLPGGRDRVCDDFGWAKSAGRPVVSTEVTIRKKDGSELPLEVRASATEKSGNGETILAFGRDITTQTRSDSITEEFDERIRFFFEKSHVGMTYVNSEYRYIAVNRALSDMTGIPIKAFIGRRLTEIWGSDSEILKHYRYVFDTGRPIRRNRVPFNCTNRRDRQPGYSDVVFMPVKDSSRKVVAACAFVIDVTEHVLAEKAARESERLYRATVESASDIICTIDREHRFVSMNQQGLAQLRAKPENVIGKKVSEVAQPKLADFLEEKYEKVFATGKGLQFEKMIKVGGEEQRWSYSLNPVLNESGETTRLVLIARDMTDARRDQREMARLFEAICCCDDGMTLTDDGGNILFVNPAMERMTGYRPGELLAKPITVFDASGGKDFTRAICSLEKRRAFRGEVLTRRKDGTAFPSDLSVSLVTDVEGRGIGVVTSTRDTTARRRAEEALRRERDNLFNILETMEDGVYIANERFELQYVNPALSKDFGPWKGHKCYEYFDGQKDVCPWCKNTEFFAGKTERREWYSSKNGKTYDLIDAPLRNPDGSVSRLEIFRDITERKKAEEALRISEELYRLHFENIRDVVYSVDREFHITSISPSVEASLGYRPEEMIGKRVDELSFVVPEYIEKGFTNVARDLAGERLDPTEYEFISRDGERKIAEISGAPLWKDGEIVSIIYVARDITDRKRAEQQVKRHQAVLEAINKVFKETLMCKTDEDVARTCLAVAEELTGSAFGFIGEVNQDGRLDTLALSNPGRNACEMPRSEAATAIKDMQIRGIWGRVIKDERSLIVNAPASHPDSVGVPGGHPPVTSFLGVPFRLKSKSLGIIALANKEGGYDVAHREDVESLAVAFEEALIRKRAEQELIETKNYLQSLLDNANDIIFTQGLDWKLTFVNRRGLEMLGYSAEDFQGLDPVELLDDEGAEKGWERRKELIKGIPKSHESRARCKNGEMLTLSVNTVPIVKAGKVTGMFAIARDVTMKKKLESELEESTTEARLLSKKLMEAQEEEKKRISRDLHDELGQLVTSAKMHVDTLTGFMEEENPEAQAVVNGLHKRLDTTLAAIRRISFSLRPNILDDLGLIPAIESYIEQFEEVTGIQYDWDCGVKDDDYPPEVKTALYRILQEALTNVARHARADRVKVGLYQTDGKLILTVEDTGCGFERSKIEAGRSLGLIGMRERANLVGGNLTVSSNIGTGTNIEAEVPIVQPH